MTSTPSPWKYFSVEELTCNCGCGQGVEHMDHTFMTHLVELREECGFPFPVNSGYRCPAYNQKVSSTGADGPHTTGRAVDIGVSRSTARELIARADSRRFPGLGSHQKGSGHRFVHLDDLGLRTWTY